MNPKTPRFSRLACGLALAALVPSFPALAEETLKVGTVAPEKSPWGMVLTTWQKVLDKRSNGAVKLQFFWNGQQGDEKAMVEKIRTGQLDSAAITATGMSNINKDVLALQMPGVFADWSKLDAARDKVRPRLDAKFDAAGFKILGWGDVGQARLMTKGFKVTKPDDLKGHGVYALAADPIGPVSYSEIGIPYKTLTITEILPALSGSTVQVLNSPALAAEQLQWASKVDHINTSATSVYAIGSVVFSSTKFKGLAPDVQAVLTETGAQAAKALTNRIRKEDDDAFARLKAKMTAYENDEAGKAAWKAMFEKVRGKLKGQKFDAALFDEIIAASK